MTVLMQEYGLKQPDRFIKNTESVCVSGYFNTDDWLVLGETNLKGFLCCGYLCTQ